MQRDIDRILIDERRIASRVDEIARSLAADLTRDLAAEGVAEPEGHVVLVPVMTGALVFAADLIRRLPMKLSLELVAVSSYPGETMASRGAHLASDLPADVAGKHVVVVDDILDSGRTMEMVCGLLLARGAATVRSVVLLDKRARRVAPIEPDYAGFVVPDEFVVGYGLDYNGYYRNLPHIATLRPEAVNNGR